MISLHLEYSACLAFEFLSLLCFFQSVGTVLPRRAEEARAQPGWGRSPACLCRRRSEKFKGSVSRFSGSKGNLSESCCSSMSITSGVLLTPLLGETWAV